MNCRDALPLLHDELDGVIDASARPALDAHVASCEACADARRQLRDLRAAIRAAPAVRAPAGFASSVMSSVAEERRIRGRILSWPRIAIPVAAAAALLVGAFVVTATRAVPERELAVASGTAASPNAEAADKAHDAWDADDALEASRRGVAKKAAPAESREESKGEAGFVAAGEKDAPDPQPEATAAEDDAEGALRDGVRAKDAKNADGRPAGASSAADDRKKAADAALAEAVERWSAPSADVFFASEAEARAFLARLGRADDGDDEARAEEPPAPVTGGAPAPGDADGPVATRLALDDGTVALAFAEVDVGAPGLASAMQEAGLRIRQSAESPGDVLNARSTNAFGAGVSADDVYRVMTALYDASKREYEDSIRRLAEAEKALGAPSTDAGAPASGKPAAAAPPSPAAPPPPAARPGATAARGAADAARSGRGGARTKSDAAPSEPGFGGAPPASGAQAGSGVGGGATGRGDAKAKGDAQPAPDAPAAPRRVRLRVFVVPPQPPAAPATPPPAGAPR